MVKKQINLQKRLKKKHVSELNPMYEKNEEIIHGRTFPRDFVKDSSDVKIVEEIGKGNFGRVFNGFLNLDSVARYLRIRVEKVGGRRSS